MKKYLFVTSALALAACGGGGHNSGNVVVPDRLVNEAAILQSNRVVTVLPTQVDNRSEIVSYVESKLGSDYYDYSVLDANPVRGTTTYDAKANIRTLTFTEKYNQARAKLDEMNKTLKEMWNMPDVSDFIAAQTTRVVEALKLVGVIPADASQENVAQIEAAFGNVDSDLLNRVNRETELNAQRIEDIIFYTATYDWDDPQGTTGLRLKTNSDKKIVNAVIQNVGDSDDIVMERVGNSENFKANTWYHYEAYNVYGAQIETNRKLELDEMKEMLKSAVEKKCAASSFCDDEMKKDSLAKIDALGEADRNVNIKENETGFMEQVKDLTVTITTLGKELGMKYADFGYLEGLYKENFGNENYEEKIIESFAGGYYIKRVPPVEMSGEMVFRGQAVGGVYYEHSDGDEYDSVGNELYVSGSKLIKTDDAKLVFNNGVETLNMNFAGDGWYNVTVTSQNGKSDIKFDGTSTDKNYALVNTQIKDFTTPDASYDGQGMQWDVHGKYKTAYYGDNNNPVEATAIVGVTENRWGTEPDNMFDHQVEFGAAFGGVKK